MLTIDEIIRATEIKFDLAAGAIKSHNRLHTVSLARNVAMYLARELTDYSLYEIGNAFNKHHTAVVSAYKRIKSMLEYESEVSDAVKHLETKLKPKRKTLLGRLFAR